MIRTWIKIYIIEIIIAYTILLTGCKRDDNETGVQPVKDPRTYTWTADTLAYPGSYQTLMYDIWGNSPKDVYVVGHNNKVDGNMWHFDGKEWIDVKLSTVAGGQIEGAFEFTSVYGFAGNNIYAVGSRIIGYNPSPPPTLIDSNLVVHYDGTVWKRVNTYNGSILDDVYGTSPSEVWAGGLDNTLYHYNGTVWESDSMNISVLPNYSFSVGSFGAYNSSIYAMGNSYDNSTGRTIYYFFQRKSNGWALQDSFANDGSGTKFGLRLNQGKLSNLFSYGDGGIYKYNGNSWENFFKTASPISSMWGFSDNNIFAVGSAGKVYHYNGQDWKQIEQLNDPNTDYWAVWTDGTEAFVVGHIIDGGIQKTIVWHGK